MLHTIKTCAFRKVLQKITATHLLKQMNVIVTENHHTVARDRDSEDAEKMAADILSNLTPDEQEKLAIYEIEKEMWHLSGEVVPLKVNNRMRLHLLKQCHDENVRKNIYRYWAITEIRRAQERSHAERKLMEDRERVNNEAKSIILFDLDQKIKAQYNNLYYAMLHGPTVVIDMGFEYEMNEIELADATNQVKYAYSCNKAHCEPVHLSLCNVDKHSKTSKLLERNLHNLYTEKPITVSSESYLDTYPREKLVYLTNDSKHYLTEYREDDIYIIGGCVDKPHRILTAKKAKRESLRTAALPISRYIQPFYGRKDLSINQVMAILLDVRLTKDWKKSIARHLPYRKTTAPEKRTSLNEHLLKWREENKRFF